MVLFTFIQLKVFLRAHTADHPLFLPEADNCSRLPFFLGCRPHPYSDWQLPLWLCLDGNQGEEPTRSYRFDGCYNGSLTYNECMAVGLFLVFGSFMSCFYFDFSASSVPAV